MTQPLTRNPILPYAKMLAKAAERLIAPHLCPVCTTEINTPGLCHACWTETQFITGITCRLCAKPFDILLPSATCGACQIDPPNFDQAIATLVYAEPTRQLILGLKHGDRLEIAPILAKIMLERTQPSMQKADFILPLPLHPIRFFTRRFNQSAELARHLVRLGGTAQKFNTQILIRHKNTPPQGHKTKAQRIQAMKGVFKTPPQQKSQIKNAHILIIDDVMTTGASASSAAKTLKRNGAKHVTISTLALVC